MTCEAALRVVLDVCELEQLSSLRAENEALRNELALWKGGKGEPEIEKYYTVTDELLDVHDVIALRCDGKEWTTVTCHDGTSYPVLEYIFTAPFKYEPDDMFGRTGWVQIRIETHELHQTSEVVWEEHHAIMFLRKDDQVVEFVH